MVTLSCGRTLSTSRFHSAASTVDSRMSSGLEDGSASCQRTNNTTISFILERSRTQSYKPEGGSSRVPTRPSWQNLTLDVFKKLSDLWSYLRVFKCIISPDELTLWVVRSFRASRSITFSSSSSASSWDHTHKTWRNFTDVTGFKWLFQFYLTWKKLLVSSVCVSFIHECAFCNSC